MISVSALEQNFDYNFPKKQIVANNLLNIKPFVVPASCQGIQYAALSLLKLKFPQMAVFNLPRELAGGFGNVRSIIHDWNKGQHNLVFANGELTFSSSRRLLGYPTIRTSEELKKHLGISDVLGVIFRGLWRPGSTYEPGDVVNLADGSSLICLSTSTNDLSKFEPYAQPAVGNGFENTKCVSKSDHGADIMTYINHRPHIIDVSLLKPNLFDWILKEEDKPKMQKGIKLRIGNRLVFTYTNGKTYTVRGLQNAKVEDMFVHYRTSTTDSMGNLTKQEVKRRITNDFSTVVIEFSSGSKQTLLDLRNERTKDISKTTRVHKTRDQWETQKAELDAKKYNEERLQELQKELAKLTK